MLITKCQLNITPFYLPSIIPNLYDIAPYEPSTHSSPSTIALLNVYYLCKFHKDAKLHYMAMGCTTLNSPMLRVGFFLA